MNAYKKVGLVAAGYVAAVIVASAVLVIYIAATAGPDRDLYSGMYAFGDSLYFLAVLGIASVPATCMGLYFLRSSPRFWRFLSVAAPVVALTGLVASADYIFSRGPENSIFGVWTFFSVLRLIVAPLLALAFVLAGLFAPDRSARVALFGATLTEAFAFGSIVVILIIKSR